MNTATCQGGERLASSRKQLWEESDMPFARHAVGTRQRHARALVLTHVGTQEGRAAPFARRGGAQGRATGGGTPAVHAP